MTADAYSSNRASRSDLRLSLLPSLRTQISTSGSLDVGRWMLDVGCFLFILSFPLFRPPRREFVRHTKVIEHPRHHRVHDLLDRLRPGIETGIGRQDRCAGEQEQL